MKYFIVTLPLFTSDMVVDSYRLVYRSSTNLFGTEQGFMALDGAMCSPGLETLNSTGLDPFTGGKPIFIEVNRYLLLAGIAHACKIPPEKVICILSKGIPFEDEYLDRCRELKALGFRIALEGVDHGRESGPLYKMADYIIVDSKEDKFVAELRVLRIQYPALKALIINIKEKKSFEELKSVRNALFSGNFYTQPLTEGISKVDPIKANAVNLLRTVSDED